MPSGAAVIDSGDIEDAVRLITQKGYGTTANSRILVLANRDEGELIQSWEKGQPSRSGGPNAKYDFIPAQDSPPFLTPAGELVGQQVPGEWNGVKIVGSYGESLLVQSDYIPSGYVAVVASYGVNSPLNVCGFREHQKPAYRNLRLIPGNYLNYQILESFAARGCGVGIRHRGAAVAIQVTVDPTYAPPDIPV